MMNKLVKMITVYGGQFGSEGKGQIVRHLSERLISSEGQHAGKLIAYRIGGPNAGHTFYVNGKPVVTCQIPGPMYLHESITGIIGPEGVIDVDILESELDALMSMNNSRPSRYPRKSRLLIDNSSVVITKEEKSTEGGLVSSIGSTGKGVGAATADKIMRSGNAVLSKDSKEIKELIEKFDPMVNIATVDTIAQLQKEIALHPGLNVIIEGTQGSGLSIHTSGHYPYCTSRECTPQGIWSGTGLHPNMAVSHESVMVVRTYPIRVAGPSGPMHKEVSWEEVSERIGREVKEITTVTKNIRRVSEIDFVALRRTVGYTCPDSIALTFLDYVDPEVYKKPPYDSSKLKDYVKMVEDELGVPVKYVGTGEGHVYDW